MCVRVCCVVCVCAGITAADAEDFDSLTLFLRMPFIRVSCPRFFSSGSLPLPPFLVAYLSPRPRARSFPSLPPASMCPQSQCEPEPKVDEAAVKRLPENK